MYQDGSFAGPRYFEAERTTDAIPGGAEAMLELKMITPQLTTCERLLNEGALVEQARVGTKSCIEMSPKEQLTEVSFRPVWPDSPPLTIAMGYYELPASCT